MNPVLKRSMIYLVTLTHRQRFSEVVEDVHSYVKDRYFINETVYLLSQNTKQRRHYIHKVPINYSFSLYRKKCKIISVRAPTTVPNKTDEDQVKSNGLSSEEAIIISDEEEKKSGVSPKY